MTLTDTARSDVLGADRPPEQHRTWWPVVALILIPAAIFAGSDLFGGHLLLNGDNLLQSYPLRVLAGSDLRGGVFPGWDPWIWSGTPLLAGLNAGAFYPTTLLFAVMNVHVAWIAAETAVYGSVGVGTYLLLRASGIGPTAGFLGAAAFAFSGAIAAQSAVHLDMGQGFASLPWMLLAVRRIEESPRWRWAVLFGVAFALVILAGAPEAMLDTAALSLTYGLIRWTLAPSARAGARLVTRGALAGAIAVGLSAIVWLPALHFIAESQRANTGATFVSEYGFPAVAGVLAVVPYLEGGLSLVSEPLYFGKSNLPEVALYVGLLAVVAVIALAARRWGAWLPRGERRCWYGVLVVGVVLALGSATPVEHLLLHIPFYGRQRDQGRNIVDVDLAACALFAWWVDGGKRPASTCSRFELVAGAAPVAVVIGFGAWLLSSPASLWRFLQAYAPTAAQLSSVRAAVAISAGLSCLALLVVVARRHLDRPRWTALVVVFTIVDLAVYSFGSSLIQSQAPPSSATPGPIVALIGSNLSPGGRYGVFDPDFFLPSALVQAGEAGIGILTGLPSVSGYGAILDAGYSEATGTNGRAFLDSTALRYGVFRQLDLQVLLTPPESFLVPIAHLPGPSVTMQTLFQLPGTDPLLPGGNVPVPQELLRKVGVAGPRNVIQKGATTGWFFGEELAPTAAAVVLTTPADRQVIRLGVLTGSGSVSWGADRRLRRGQDVASVPLAGRPARGLELQLVSGPPLGPSRLAVGVPGHSFLVDGPLAEAVTPGSWRQVASVGGFALFRTLSPPRQVWLQSLSSLAGASGPAATGLLSTRAAGEARPGPGPASLGAANVVDTSPNGATVAVTANTPALLVRSSAWDTGWQAVLVDPNGRTTPLVVRHVGLVQGVEVPRGSHVVRFRYVPVGLALGAETSGATLGLLLLGSIGSALESRRRRRPPPGPEPVPAAAGPPGSGSVQGDTPAPVGSPR